MKYILFILPLTSCILAAPASLHIGTHLISLLLIPIPSSQSPDSNQPFQTDLTTTTSSPAHHILASTIKESCIEIYTACGRGPNPGKTPCCGALKCLMALDGLGEEFCVKEGEPGYGVASGSRYMLKGQDLK
ncbi:hypothetical protein WAI453_008853 [Rhynchosporium graminicola]